MTMNNPYSTGIADQNNQTMEFDAIVGETFPLADEKKKSFYPILFRFLIAALIAVLLILYIVAMIRDIIEDIKFEMEIDDDDEDWEDEEED